MRVIATLFLLLLAPAAARPAFASGGLPMLGMIDAGPYRAALHNDSPTLVTGANAITVQIDALPEGSTVRLMFDGAANTSIDVPLTNVLVVGGFGGSHGIAAHDQGHGGIAGHGDAHAPAVGSPVPGVAIDARGLVVPAAPGAPALVAGQHEDGSRPFQARGVVTLPRAGMWTARLTIVDHHGLRFSGEMPLAAAPGGPNGLYLSAVGSLITGTLLYGTVQRRRRSGRTRITS